MNIFSSYYKAELVVVIFTIIIHPNEEVWLQKFLHVNLYHVKDYFTIFDKKFDLTNSFYEQRLLTVCLHFSSIFLD